MEKRRLTSLRSVLLQYLVRTALACLLVAVGWLLVVLLWICLLYTSPSPRDS